MARDHLPSRQYELAVEACEHAGVRSLDWRDASSPWLESDWPALVVAGLPSGCRRLPPDLNALLSKNFPKLPLLLLCEEALIRPTVVSHGGRVVLIGMPLSAARISSRIRMLTANAAPVHAGRWRGNRSQATGAWDRLGTRYWVGSLQSGGERSAVVHEGSEGSLLALVPLADAAASPELAGQLDDVLSRKGPLGDKERALVDGLGERFAALHLPPNGDEWTFYRPSPNSCLRLCAHQRLPPLWDHPDVSARPEAIVKRAASGDLVVLGSGARPALWRDPELDVWMGGPGLLAEFAAQRANGDETGGVVVVEVL
ncbi:MAG TPA: hypothetical protein VNN80_26385 [Polyangiaceae bacterium]|nr:hypothetical protein [Polyangiaceae bacterium]